MTKKSVGRFLQIDNAGGLTSLCVIWAQLNTKLTRFEKFSPSNQSLALVERATRPTKSSMGQTRWISSIVSSSLE